MAWRRPTLDPLVWEIKIYEIVARYGFTGRALVDRVVETLRRHEMKPVPEVPSPRAADECEICGQCHTSSGEGGGCDCCQSCEAMRRRRGLADPLAWEIECYDVGWSGGLEGWQLEDWVAKMHRLYGRERVPEPPPENRDSSS